MREEPDMNKRDAVLQILDDGGAQGYVPAAFFLHFDPQFHRGQSAVDKHLEYFRATGMDFVKIQYEHTFPRIDSIRHPLDWRNMPLYREDFFAEPLEIVAGLVEAAKEEALVLVTLYSPFMCAGHTVSGATVTDHLLQDPQLVQPGLETITASLMHFVQACIRLGVDGFYMSTQGGEAGHFADAAIFQDYIKPYDLALMEEIDRNCPFNVLHVCDYHGPYADLTPFLDYPGHVVNCSLQVGNDTMSGTEVARLFGRPFMGGMERHGVIAHGDDGAIRGAVKALLDDAPARYLLGADCTLPADTDWANIRTAIAAAHGEAV